MPDGLGCTIDGDCDESDKIDIRTEGSCSSYTGGCDLIDELNSINSYLGMVYKSLQH